MIRSANVVVSVAVEKTAYSFDKLFDYNVPKALWDAAQPGCRVTVPFGRGNRHRQGMIFSRSEISELRKELKQISSVSDSTPSLSEELLLLAGWLRENCFCTWFEAAKLMLPTGLNVQFVCAYRIAEGVDMETLAAIDDLTAAERRVAEGLAKSGATVERDVLLEVMKLAEGSDIPERLVKRGLIVRTDDEVRKTGDAKVRMVRMCGELPEDGTVRITPRQREIADLLLQAGCASVKEMHYLTGVSLHTLRTMERNGLLEIYDQERYRRPEGSTAARRVSEEIVLTAEQQTAYENMYRRLHSGTASTTLLFGITGSGKTSVFMRLIDDVVAEGRGVIVMVPEIALTPQTLERFSARYGDRVAVFHSGLTLGQRLDEWKRVKNGDAQIAIGTRSAVFAPFEDLGLIIMDEEQEYTYKSESAPRYHARDAARFRAAYHKTSLILASATPSIESYYRATEEKRYFLETLTGRYGSAVLPEVEIVDLSEQRVSQALISPRLYDAINENLENGCQSILLHNRRGYNTFVSCRACGHVLSCRSCSVSMNYHHDIGRLVCHYCGESAPFTLTCPVCGAEQLRYAGQGTQRAEDELERLFPKARILRMDADTTVSRLSYSEKLGAFARSEYDIMVGTQMVAKGLDFEKVTLVGVVLADQMLYSDDFRSYERAFSLLTQVVGRSGRGERRGRAIIQTMTPESPVIAMASRQDYPEFYRNEIKMRRAMLYPPFSDVCVVGFSGQFETEVRETSAAFFLRLRQLAEEKYAGLPLRVLSPSDASVHRVKGKYRRRIIIKCRRSESLKELLGTLLREFTEDRRAAAVQVFIDMNPTSIF